MMSVVLAMRSVDAFYLCQRASRSAALADPQREGPDDGSTVGADELELDPPAAVQDQGHLLGPAQDAGAQREAAGVGSGDKSVISVVAPE